MRRLVKDNGTNANLTGHAPDLSVLMPAVLDGGMGLIVLIGLFVWLN